MLLNCTLSLTASHGTIIDDCLWTKKAERLLRQNPCTIWKWPHCKQSPAECHCGPLCVCREGHIVLSWADVIYHIERFMSNAKFNGKTWREESELTETTWLRMLFPYFPPEGVCAGATLLPSCVNEMANDYLQNFLSSSSSRYFRLMWKENPCIQGSLSNIYVHVFPCSSFFGTVAVSLLHHHDT